MAGLVDRVKNILLTPKTEWPVIDAESGDTKEVFTYVAILALLPLVGSVLGGLLATAALPITGTFVIVGAIVGYILTFIVVYVVAFIINALAPTFNSEPHMPSALKLTAYSFTASWVGGLFGFIPIIGGLIGLAGAIYSLVLLYLGLPVLMRTPQDKVIGYFIVSLICAIVVWAVIAFVIGGLLLLPFAGLALR
jgi:hypothetical protein